MNSRVQLFATPWTIVHQAPLFMGFPRQEDWSGLPFLSPGDLPHPGIEPRSPALQVILYQLSYQESNENDSSHLLHTSDVTSTLLGVLCE